MHYDQNDRDAGVGLVGEFYFLLMNGGNRCCVCGRLPTFMYVKTHAIDCAVHRAQRLFFVLHCSDYSVQPFLVS